MNKLRRYYDKNTFLLSNEREVISTNTNKHYNKV